MYFAGKTLSSDADDIGTGWSYDGVTWVLHESAVVEKGPAGAWDDVVAEGPAVAWRDDALLLYYRGQRNRGSDAIGVALVKRWFIKDSAPPVPVLFNGSTYDADSAYDPYVVYSYLSSYGYYYMVYSADNSTETSICIARSTDPSSWGNTSKWYQNPILTEGASGTYDDESVRRPCIIWNGRYWLLYYSAYDGADSSIGLAYTHLVDPRTKSWTKHGKVFEKNTQSLAWDSNAVTDPCVIKVGSYYHMWYRGGFPYSIGHATSSNGYTWARDSANPVFSADASIDWEGTSIGGFCVRYEGGLFTLYYSTGVSDNVFGMAYSTTGSHWTRDPQNPYLMQGNSSDWDDALLDLGCVIEVGGVQHAYYHTTGGKGNDILHASRGSDTGRYFTSVLDASHEWPVEWSTLSWDASLPVGTHARFQVATNNGGPVWNFVGPDGTAGTYYTTSGTHINPGQSGRYLRVQAWLDSDDLARFVPCIRSITVMYKTRDSPCPPEVTLTSPDGGEDWMKTKAYPITWIAVGNFDHPCIELHLSTDNGSTWTLIATGLGNTGFYCWTVPNSETSGALVRVFATDVDGVTSEDVSDATFAIDPPPPKSGEFLAPLTGEALAPGTSTAEWTVYDPWGLAEAPLTLELTTDGGLTWTLLADGLPLTDTYEWEVPDLAASSTRCQLRLSVLDWLGGISVIESGEFTIDMSAPVVTLDNVGKLKVGEELTVTATCTDDLDVAEVFLLVRGEEGTRALSMERGEGDVWSVLYVPEVGDVSLSVTTTDGVHETASAPVDIEVNAADGGTGAVTSTGLMLVASAAMAATVTITLFLLASRRGSGIDKGR
jgi:predicted GH43/DUF377 family glycosyl hydrolase